MDTERLYFSFAKFKQAHSHQLHKLPQKTNNRLEGVAFNSSAPADSNSTLDGSVDADDLLHSVNCLPVESTRATLPRIS